MALLLVFQLVVLRMESDHPVWPQCRLGALTASAAAAVADPAG